MICKGKTAVLIISFNPDINRLSESLDILRRQVDKILIVDNGSNNCIELSEIAEYNEVIFNGENLGIATALNIGMQQLQNEGYEWVLTMDQDSLCSENLIETLLSSAKSDIGIVCPRVIYENWKEQPIKNTVKEVKACMTSGSLTNVQAWQKCGKFDETFFIDYVDNDFCMKLHLCGYRIVRNSECCIRHCLGSLRKTKILRIKYISHSPNRYYYITRNNLLFIRKYSNELFLLKEYAKVLYILGTAVLFEENKGEILRAIKNGIRDYKAMENDLCV